MEEKSKKTIEKRRISDATTFAKRGLNSIFRLQMDICKLKMRICKVKMDICRLKMELVRGFGSFFLADYLFLDADCQYSFCFDAFSSLRAMSQKRTHCPISNTPFFISQLYINALSFGTDLAG